MLFNYTNFWKRKRIHVRKEELLQARIAIKAMRISQKNNMFITEKKKEDSCITHTCASFAFVFFVPSSKPPLKHCFGVKYPLSIYRLRPFVSFLNSYFGSFSHFLFCVIFWDMSQSLLLYIFSLFCDNMLIILSRQNLYTYMYTLST